MTGTAETRHGKILSETNDDATEGRVLESAGAEPHEIFTLGEDRVAAYKARWH